MRSRSAALILTMALLASGAVASATAGPASASPAPATSAAARVRANQLRADVERLTVARELATEEYDQANADYAALVSRSVLAQQQLDEMQAAADAAKQQRDDRIRALYMSGGPAGMLSSVMGAESLDEATSRLYAAGSVVRADQGALTAQNDVVKQADSIRKTIADLTDQQNQAAQAARFAMSNVQSLLSERQRLLQSADAEVTRLANAEAAAAQARAEAAAAAALAASNSSGRFPAVGSVPAPTRVAAAAVEAARTRLGKPYVWGAEGPNAFDCSGLVQWSYDQAGLHLPRTARPQYRATKPVAFADLAPGDLLFWANNTADWNTIHHVALYIGNGYMIAAPDVGDVVKIQRVYLDGFFGATRPTA